MKHAIEHDLDTPMAKKVADKAFESYKQRFADYHPTMRWVSERRAEIGFNAKGVKLAGTMDIEERRIDVDLDVPFLLRPFKNLALEAIDREVRLWVGKAHAGEL
jgi:hypothetical protein